MDKYEYKLRTEQMLEFMEDKEYTKAAEVADTIDWHRVRNISMLVTVGDIYEKTRNYSKSYEILKIVYDRSAYRQCHLLFISIFGEIIPEFHGNSAFISCRLMI